MEKELVRVNKVMPLTLNVGGMIFLESLHAYFFDICLLDNRSSHSFVFIPKGLTTDKKCCRADLLTLLSGV